MPSFAINAEAQNSSQTFGFKICVSFMAVLRFPAKSLLIEPISLRTLCYITISMFLLSSKCSSSQGTFLGDQTGGAWRYFTGTVTERGIMPVKPLRSSVIRLPGSTALYANLCKQRTSQPLLRLSESQVWHLVWHSLTLQSLPS